MKTFTLLGLLLGFLGCAALYLSSENQRWLKRRWRTSPARLAALCLLAASCACFMQDMQGITAVFVLATQTMLWLALLPYLGALRGAHRNP